MTCPECYYDRWDGKSAHLYGGRASAKLQCFGPRRPIVPKRNLDEALAQANKDMAASRAKPAPIETVTAKETAPVQPTKAQTRVSKLIAAIDALESKGFSAVKASELTAASRTSGRRNPSADRSRKSRRVRKGRHGHSA